MKLELSLSGSLTPGWEL